MAESFAPLMVGAPTVEELGRMTLDDYARVEGVMGLSDGRARVLIADTPFFSAEAELWTIDTDGTATQKRHDLSQTFIPDGDDLTVVTVSGELLVVTGVGDDSFVPVSEHIFPTARVHATSSGEAWFLSTDDVSAWVEEGDFGFNVYNGYPHHFGDGVTFEGIAATGGGQGFFVGKRGEVQSIFAIDNVDFGWDMSSAMAWETVLAQPEPVAFPDDWLLDLMGLSSTINFGITPTADGAGIWARGTQPSSENPAYACSTWLARADGQAEAAFFNLKEADPRLAVVTTDSIDRKIPVWLNLFGHIQAPDGTIYLVGHADERSFSGADEPERLAPFVLSWDPETGRAGFIARLDDGTTNTNLRDLDPYAAMHIDGNGDLIVSAQVGGTLQAPVYGVWRLDL
ncbi:MAG: hypothetical protein AAFV53_22445 [Myxococcota bacterium]